MKRTDHSDGGRQKGEVSATEMAKRLEVTPQAIGQWCRRPGAPARVEGRNIWIQAAAFLRWRERELIEQAVRESAPSVSYEEARTRKALAEAEMVEIEVAKARGEVVSVEDTGKVIGTILDRLCSRLRALPVRLAHLGAHVEEAANFEAEYIIAELSSFNEDVLPEPEDEQNAATEPA